MIIVANWKMKLGFQESKNFLVQFKSLIAQQPDLEDLIFLPPSCLSMLFQEENFYWGGQNVYSQEEGAFTGETSAKVLKEMGAHFCLLGHSERRHIFGESDAEIEKKFHLLQSLDLIPIVCVGESLDQHSEKEKVLKQQLSWIQKNEKYRSLPWRPEKHPLSFQKIPFLIAYEPLWSIGTGKRPSQEEIHETAQFIKEELSFPELKILYGGSVDEKFAKGFLDSSFVDGFLVGGASLNPKTLYTIYQQVCAK